jgi:hypothetical protein
MKHTVNAVLTRGLSNVKAASQYKVPLETLRRKVLVAKSGGGVEKKFGRPTVLTDDEEEELCHILLDMESKLYGLSLVDVRHLVFKYCSKNNIKHSFNSDSGMAGRYWFAAFMSRHPELSLRQPEPVSIQRAQGFNRPKVQRFLIH